MNDGAILRSADWRAALTVAAARLPRPGLIVDIQYCEASDEGTAVGVRRYAPMI